MKIFVSWGLAIAFGLIGAGCQSRGSKPIQKPTNKSPAGNSADLKLLIPVTEATARALALREAKRRGWNNVEADKAVFVNGLWIVAIWRLPKTPGGFVMVEIAPNGQIVNLEPGQ